MHFRSNFDLKIDRMRNKLLMLELYAHIREGHGFTYY